MSLLRRGMLVIAATIVLGTGAAWAEDLDARKTGPQLFEATCTACHRSPHGLARNQSASSLVDFLRQHYTTGPGPAGQLAAYLMANPGDGRARAAGARGEPQRGAARQAEPSTEQPGAHRHRAQRGGRKPGEGQGSEPATPVAHVPEGAPGRAEASPDKRGPNEAKPTAAAEAPAAAPSEMATPSAAATPTPTATAASADASAGGPAETGDQSAFSAPTP